MLQIVHEAYRGLNYPWGRRAAPRPAEPEQLADGVWWARFPMPMTLDHINVWLLEDGNGWTIVDTCLNLPESRQIWEEIFATTLQGRPVVRVISTHMHPDHVGLAGWLCQRFDCDLWMTREEYLTCSLMTSYTNDQVPAEAIEFYARAGYTNEQLSEYRRKFGSFGKVISPLPHSFRRIVDRETITIGSRYWQVIVGSGHSPEHACLYCPALKVLISGDQVLPRITPNVSVFPSEPEGNPLAEWLESSARLTRILPEDLLVLPSHQAPFTGLHTRLNQIIESHRHGLQSLYEYLETPKRAIDCFPSLFNRTITDDLVGMATGETLAHLNLLLSQRNITRQPDAEGVYWYIHNPETRHLETDDITPDAA